MAKGRVLALAADDTASGRYRVFIPMRALSEAGWDVHATLDPIEFSAKLDWADIVLMHRPMMPLAERVAVSLAGKKPVIVDLDDLVHMVPPQVPQLRRWREGSDNLKILTRVVRNAAGLIVSSNELYRYYYRYNPHIYVVPNGIDFAYRDWSVRAQPSRLTVLWSGGSQHHLEIEQIAAVFDWLLDGYPQVDIAVHAHPAFAGDILRAMRCADPARMLFYPVVTFDSYPHMLCRAHIGIAPLSNDPFSRARCFHPDTIVYTPRGQAKIGTIKEGDWVWNGEQFVKVDAVSRESGDLGVEVLLESGSLLIMTSTHRVLTQSGYLLASQLRPNDLIATGSVRLESQNPMSDDECRSWVSAVMSSVRDHDRMEKCAQQVMGRLTEEVAHRIVELLKQRARLRRGKRYALSVPAGLLRQVLLDILRAVGYVVVQDTHSRRANCIVFWQSEGRPQYVRVLQVRHRWLQESVDIQVRGGFFVANGIISHNSTLKPLEYAAAGLVPVVSFSGEYALLAKREQWLPHASSLDDWKKVLGALVEEPDRLNELAAKASLWCREHHDIRCRVTDYERAFEGIQRGDVAPFVYYEPSHPRKAPCVCGSGLRYDRCCRPAFG